MDCGRFAEGDGQHVSGFSEERVDSQPRAIVEQIETAHEWLQVDFKQHLQNALEEANALSQDAAQPASDKQGKLFNNKTTQQIGGSSSSSSPPNDERSFAAMQAGAGVSSSFFKPTINSVPAASKLQIAATRAHQHLANEITKTSSGPLQ